MSCTFSPPPLEEPDFKKDSSFVSWDTFINSTTNAVIELEEETVGSGNCQYYNPKDNPAGTDKSVATVTWNGFPKRLMVDFPETYYEVADRKHGWPKNDTPIARNQDEYLEWYVYKNDQDKITRIDFTCESPEYFDNLLNWEPDVCLQLYRDYISPDVQLVDLYKVGATGEKMYDMYNKWNTRLGAMHLNCPPNSLQAEIQLAGDATIIRKDANGETIEDPQQLIDCSKYGLATRNSDPHIGSACNTLCRDGKRITLANPVCLYIARVDTSGMTLNGEDASHYMQMVRGIAGQGLRYSLSVPAEEGFTVSDIKIAGIGIEYGGEIADLIEVGLMAEYDTGVKQPAYSCPPAARTQIPKEHPLLQAHTILKSNKYCMRL